MELEQEKKEMEMKVKEAEQLKKENEAFKALFMSKVLDKGDK